MRIRLFIAILGMILIAGIINADEPKFNTNTVYMDSVTAHPGEHFGVNIYLFNVDSLAGAQVPVFYRSEEVDLVCDSISLEGSRMGYMMFEDRKIPRDDNSFYIGFINTIDPENWIPPLGPGDGLLATVYFTVPDDAKEAVIPLARGIIPHPAITFNFTVWDGIGDELDGDLIESQIIIKKKSEK